MHCCSRLLELHEVVWVIKGHLKRLLSSVLSMLTGLGWELRLRLHHELGKTLTIVEIMVGSRHFCEQLLVQLLAVGPFGSSQLRRVDLLLLLSVLDENWPIRHLQ